jgi:prefoldin subunit 5
MNKTRAKRLQELVKTLDVLDAGITTLTDELEDVFNELTEFRDYEQKKFDNLSEKQQESYKGARIGDAIAALSQAMKTLEPMTTAFTSLADVVTEINNASECED